MTCETDLDKRPSATHDHVARSVPVIDIGDPASVQQIADACREWGFFQITNHGVSPDLIGRTW